MRAFRARSSVLTPIVLTWQIVAVMFVPAALCCRLDQTASGPHAAMADCPMEHGAAEAPEAFCPLHSQQTTVRDCDCPRLGCSQTDNGFMALSGPIAVLTAPTPVPMPHLQRDVAPVFSPSTESLAPDPVAPPPRF